jgi:Flp pilus assembly protein TadD
MTVKLTVAMLLLTGVAGCSSMSDPTSSDIFDSRGTGKFKEVSELARDVEAHDSIDTALVLYRQAVTVSGRSPAAYVQLGDAYIRAKKLNEAIEAYRAALAINAGDAQAQLGLGTALVRHGDLQKGIAMLVKAAPHVNTGAAYNRLGVAQTMAGQFQEAQEAFERGLGIAPDDLDIVTNLALAAALGDNAEKAGKMAGLIATSSAAKPVHRRNLVIVLGIIGKSSQDARAVAPEGITRPEFDSLFARAASIRHITDPVTRARVLGTMQS